jgi:hypothetical protein
MESLTIYLKDKTTITADYGFIEFDETETDYTFNCYDAQDAGDQLRFIVVQKSEVLYIDFIYT